MPPNRMPKKNYQSKGMLSGSPYLIGTTRTIRLGKTKRSYEEDQERAYIAASRRSDRSLDARIESARKASEIHKKRTGRAFRVTEQDVVNEKMYAEEDIEYARHYRRMRLMGDLWMMNSVYQRNFQSHVALQVERSNLQDKAGSGDDLTKQSLSDNVPFSGQAACVNPTPMQTSRTQLPDESQPSGSPHTWDWESSTFHRKHDPLTGGQHQEMPRSCIHHCSDSMSTLQDMLLSWPQYSKAAQRGAVETMRLGDQRLSLHSQATHSQRATSQPAHAISHITPTSVACISQPSPQLPCPYPPQQSLLQHQQYQPLPGPGRCHLELSPGLSDPCGPLTVTLPKETRQGLARSVPHTEGDSIPPMESPSGFNQHSSFYRYNPNAKTKEPGFDRIPTRAHEPGDIAYIH